MDYTRDKGRENEDRSGEIREEKEKNIPVIEEKVKVDKKTIETSTVRVIKKVREEDVTVDLPVIKEEVDVERIPVNRYVDVPPAVRHEGDTMIVPVMKEVIEKRLILVEEVRITKRRMETEVNQQQVTLRKEEVSVEREFHDRTRE